MYSIKGDGVIIYSDVSPTESCKAVSPKLTLKDNAAGSLDITLPPGNAGYDLLKHMLSEVTVYRDKKEIWSGRIIGENGDFWNNRVLTCEGELAYLRDTIQPQRKYEKGTTVGAFLESVLNEHNKRKNEERYRFYIDKSYIYNYDEPMPETVTDFECTLDCIKNSIVDVFECHIMIEKINGKKYIKMVKEEAYFNENTQVIRFGDNLLDFVKSWDLTDMGTVIIPKGAAIESDSNSDSDAFDSYVTLEGIPKDNVVETSELGEYLRDENGKLLHDEDGNLIYEYHDKKDENGNLVYKYEKDADGFIVLESDSQNRPTMRVNTNENSEDKTTVEFIEYSEDQAKVTSKIVTDGLYADVYLKNEQDEFCSLKDTYGHIEKVGDFSEAQNFIELLKATRDYIKEHRFDEMTLEVSAVDMRYMSDKYEPIKLLDRVRCISHPHAMNTLFTVTELSIEIDKADGAQYTLQKSLESLAMQTSLSSEVSSVTSELESPHSNVLKRAQSNADKLLRESVNGYVSLITDTANGRHSEALVISSGRDYRRSEHFWIFNVNGLGHYTEYAGADTPTPDSDDKLSVWDDAKEYVLNLGITMDGAIVANRITVGHMSADRVRTGVLISQDGNVIWNLNKDDCDVTYSYTDTDGNEQFKTISCPGGSMSIKKGSIALGNGAFSVDNNGYLHAVNGFIGGFHITANDIHNDSMTLDESGLILTNENVNVGRIGTTFWTENPNEKVLVMDLEHDASAIGWGVRQTSSASSYSTVFLYANKNHQSYRRGNFYMHGNLNIQGFALQNCNINDCNINPNECSVEGGISGNCILLTENAINSDGTINKAYAKKVKVQNGFIVSR